uniref:Colanic acid biosynthesis glycosyl transferase, putative n=1 Tax=Solibacter usitatus (strain Ellin6076) TaxID=234267 RepID=Q01XM6_SOLUE
MSQPDSEKRPVALVLYHYLYPDDVVSSVLFSDLCAGLTERGWKVVGSACNRGCRDEGKKYPARSHWKGVDFWRVWRPRFRQSSGLGRLANALWMIACWSLMALDPRIRPDLVLMGTDPILSPVVVFAWRILRPRVRFAHWCHDLYPDAAIAAGLVEEGTPAVRSIKWLLGAAYRRQSLIVDIGACMRRLLESYRSGACMETIPPWALVELEGPAPVDAGEQRELFGDARIGLLYSGVFGRAHTSEGLAELARALADRGGRVVFSVGGNAAEELRESMRQSGAPVTFAPMVSTDRLAARLSAADVQIVTLRESWTGTVIPSKFFGALAIGRPVLFVGSPDSAIATWITELGVGWVLRSGAVEEVVKELMFLADNPEPKAELFRHCHKVYMEKFSRGQALDRWDVCLRGALKAGKG